MKEIVQEAGAGKGAGTNPHYSSGAAIRGQSLLRGSAPGYTLWYHSIHRKIITPEAGNCGESSVCSVLSVVKMVLSCFVISALIATIDADGLSKKGVAAFCCQIRMKKGRLG
jgi:hypothetical protein